MNVGKETWGRLSPLLDELLDLPDGDRDARLDALRAQDPHIAQAVAAMLEHLPAIERGEFMPSAALPKPGGLAGQAIGPYTLEREIGHGGDVEHVTLNTAIGDSVTRHDDEILRVDEAMQQLAVADKRLHDVVELRYFGGLSEAEIAAILGVTERTVQRDWQKARLFLSSALNT